MILLLHLSIKTEETKQESFGERGKGHKAQAFNKNRPVQMQNLLIP